MGKTVIALGFFDGLHLGHAALLERAKARAAEFGAAPAILTFDIHPDTFVKGERVELLNSADDRAYIARRFFGIERLFFIHVNAENRIEVVGRLHLRSETDYDDDLGIGIVFSESVEKLI